MKLASAVIGSAASPLLAKTCAEDKAAELNLAWSGHFNDGMHSLISMKRRQ
jgi:hypothetical protein